ncbi:hypothetical protein C0992_008734 [Termitomyces sp. T32_za158]|nr:hypothetical protein C0992_008734 [Termitomyces sp. T32_za158]
MESATAPPTSRVGKPRHTPIARHTTATQGTPPTAIKDRTAKITPSPPTPTPIVPEPTTPMLNPLAAQPTTHTTAPPPATDTEVATAYQGYTPTRLPLTQRLYPYLTATGALVSTPVQPMLVGRSPRSTSSSPTPLPIPSRDLQDLSTGSLQPATATTTVTTRLQDTTLGHPRASLHTPHCPAATIPLPTAFPALSSTQIPQGPDPDPGYHRINPD